ncbi:MAG: hypothetical protein HOO67_06045 [Candidatus Peribacteraceae bacterium]|nr:hypothetical protein [Candidatus Peribacteraceae bacterium]
MTKLNLDCPVRSLANEPIPGSHLGKLLADALAMSADGKAPPLKYWGWAVRLFAGEELFLDETDSAILETFVTSHGGLVVLVKAQILARLKAKE